MCTERSLSIHWTFAYNSSNEDEGRTHQLSYPFLPCGDISVHLVREVVRVLRGDHVVIFPQGPDVCGDGRGRHSSQLFLAALCLLLREGCRHTLVHLRLLSTCVRGLEILVIAEFLFVLIHVKMCNSETHARS